MLVRLLTVDVNIISNAECEYKDNVYKVRLLTPYCAQVYHRVER